MRAFFLFSILLLAAGSIPGQGLLPDSLISMTGLPETLECSVRVHVMVPGVNMPDKELYVKYEPGKKPVIRGHGLILLPKKGLFGQIRELTETPYQAIAMGAVGDTVIYKLVSLDPKSDWITADLYITPLDKRVHRLNLMTRDHGAFEIRHSYGLRELPLSTLVSFESLPTKLPIKFLGRNSSTHPEEQPDGKVRGSVRLEYSTIEN